MRRAINVAQTAGVGKPPFALFDTQETAQAAAKAAAAAVRGKASAIIGPVFAGQVAAVASAVRGAIPVISLSNTIAAVQPNLFHFGVTPSQSTSAILQYARARGVRRVALVGTGSRWSESAGRAARLLAAEIGIELVELPPGNAVAGAGLLTALQGAAGGLPDAALFTGEPTQFAASAQALQAEGVQVLGTIQAFDPRLPPPPALDNVWISAADPHALASFGQSYAALGSGVAGPLAALAYDAAVIARMLEEAGALNREGLLRPAGFAAVTGAVRFRPDGRCVREFAILSPLEGKHRVVDRKAGL
jgi:ABC-type branched-subunit amino acid transport system substrate-binding protein